MVTRALSKAHGTATILAHMPEQTRIPYLPLERLYEMRDQRVRQMVRYAAETVPYYQELFRKLCLQPRDIRTAQDLDRLPLLDKALVREHPERFVSDSPWGRMAFPFVTSGTTGQPTQIFHDRCSLLLNSAINVRHRDVLREVLGRGWGVRGLAIATPGAMLDRMQSYLDQLRFAPPWRRRASLSTAVSVQKAVDVINERRPHVLGGDGGYLEGLFRTVAARRMEMHAPDVVYYGTAAITDSTRQFIEDAYGAVVLSSYEAVEALKIGFQCEERTGFHLHIDLTDVKIVDERGRRMPPGEKGEVVISNLVNHGTVLLNYRLGDVAALCQEPCPCGRTLPLLTELEGRVEDIIYLSNGEFVHPRLVWKAMKYQEGLLRYQLVQQGPEEFELRLCTISDAAFQRIAAQATAELRPLLGESAAIQAVYSETLETPSGGKFRPVVSLVESPTGARCKR